MTAPYGTIDDAGRVILSERVNRAAEKIPNKTFEVSKGSDRQMRKLPMKKLNVVMDVKKNNQIRNAFARVPDSDASACFNDSFWYPGKTCSRHHSALLILYWETAC